MDNTVVRVKNTTIREADDFLLVRPCVVPESATLEQVARRMTEAPGARTICVVDQQDRLVGVVAGRSLFEDIFFSIVPEEFLAEIVDYQRSSEVAHLTAVHTARDIMVAPVYVRMGDKVQDAFRLMHENKIYGLPIVDDDLHVIGYIDMIELLLVWLKVAEARQP